MGEAMLEDWSEALAAEGVARRRLCGFSQWLDTLGGEDRRRAQELVGDRTYTCRQLAAYFASKGATFNDQVLNRHRNARCCGQG